MFQLPFGRLRVDAAHLVSPHATEEGTEIVRFDVQALTLRQAQGERIRRTQGERVRRAQGRRVS
jgi:hypothetical protein